MKRAISRATKVRLASQLLRAKNFVVVTDKEAAMGLKVNDDLNGVIKLATAKAELEHFKDKLTGVIDEIDKGIDEELSKPKKKRSITVVDKSNKAQKVKVKRG